MRFILLLVAVCSLSSVLGYSRKSSECTNMCNDLRREVLTLEICKEAKRTLPRPKVGDYCSTSMEQGFSDVCFALCMGEKAVSRIAQACRGAAAEQPRPTVRRWCEHGYTQAFQKTQYALATHFENLEPAVVVEEALPVVDVVTPVVEELSETAEEIKAEIARLPVVIGDRHVDLIVYEGQTAEDAVIALCRKHDKDHDVSGCIRHLLPSVLEQIQ